MKITKQEVAWDCKEEAKNKVALYLEDFSSLEVWEIICKKFNVPKGTDQIYFNPKDITYG